MRVCFSELKRELFIRGENPSPASPLSRRATLSHKGPTRGEGQEADHFAAATFIGCGINPPMGRPERTGLS